MIKSPILESEHRDSTCPKLAIDLLFPLNMQRKSMHNTYVRKRETQTHDHTKIHRRHWTSRINPKKKKQFGKESRQGNSLTFTNTVNHRR